MRNRITGIVLVVCLSSMVAASVSAQEIESLEGMKSVKAVFDIRNSNPQKAVRILNLVHKSYKDLTAAGKNPEFKVVFMGPSVKLFSTTREGFVPEDKEQLDGIAKSVSALSKDGIDLEICKIAMSAAKVDPTTVLPEIKGVANGWFSSIGYQSQGYSLVPIF